jgi:hypothetical protein
MADAEFIVSARADVPRLLQAARLMLRSYAPYVNPDEYAAVLAALTGEGKTDD